MAYGQKMGSLKALKKSMAKGSGGAFIKYIPKNGSMNVRFIEEPEHWVNYVEHFDAVRRRSFPCNGEQGCPGCKNDERKSSRYLANAVDRDDNDRVIPLQMPKDLANRLVVRYERNGTLTDRDFELSRSGDGLDTVYDLDAGIVDRAKIDKFQPHDLLKVLEDAFDSVFGGGDDDDDDDAPVAKKAATRGRARSSAAGMAVKSTAVLDADVDDEEDDEDEAPAPVKPRKKSAAAAKKSTPAKKAAAKKAAPEPEFTPEVDDEDDEEEPEVDEPVESEEPEDEGEDEPDEDEADEDDDIEYDEDTLKAMPMGVLRKVARDEFGVTTRGLSQQQIIDAIMDAGEEVGDDEPPF